MFQSTPSGGKATRRGVDGDAADVVSIHAFRGEGDRGGAARVPPGSQFQSTPSGGKATSSAL